MNIQEAIVHRFDKEKHKPSSAAMRKDALVLDDKLRTLVASVRDVFNRTATRGYGAFQPDQTAYPFSVALKKYIAMTEGVAKFSLGLQVSYQRVLDGAQASTGGYLFFARYQENQKDFLLIFSLKLRPGTSIDDKTLTINEAVTLDIDHLHEAARINLTDWNENKESYVTFVKRRKNGDDKSATDYFRDFLGVTELTESSAQTKLLLQAIQQYCDDRKLDSDKSREVRQRVHAYCTECTKEKKGISLAALSLKLNDLYPTDFTDFLNDKDVHLSDGFEPNSRVYRSLRRYRIKDSKLTLDFEESILGSRVTYDEVNEWIIIKEIPSELKEKLKGVQ